MPCSGRTLPVPHLGPPMAPRSTASAFLAALSASSVRLTSGIYRRASQVVLLKAKLDVIAALLDCSEDLEAFGGDFWAAVVASKDYNVIGRHLGMPC